MRIVNFFLKCMIFLLLIGCSAPGNLKIVREVTGPYQTNSYLVYDTKSGEAAIIDPGWKIDTLSGFIKDNGLDIKYILITHGHTDHYYFVPLLKKEFPGARWGMSREDYEKIVKCPDWFAKAYGQEWVDETRKNAEESIYLDFDPISAGVPDFFIQGNQVFRLGKAEIKTISTPGHSPGGICFYTGRYLFSGDELFYRSVGNLDFLTSNTVDFKKSVRELYRSLPDSTIVMPGHGKPTDTGSEKRYNERISLEGGLDKWWHFR